ncbi:MAG TPA: dihydrofolate reductase family protein [Candidatus Limnocylindria bacterium]|nr:dihydrofolate reductase family protein [Candidatus Limnocylindria bacterium]
MRRLVVGTFLTLDGVMQAPGGPEEDREGGFERGGWSVNYWDELMGKTIVEWTVRAGALLLGRKTYQIFAAHWPKVSDDDPVARTLNSVPKYVASRTLKEVAWRNSTLLQGDVAEAVARLKRSEGEEIQVHGSGDLIQTLLGHDLVDELRLWFFPVSLGHGKRLFAGGTLPRTFTLTDTKTSTTGVAIHTYQAAGGIRYGSFAVDEHGRADALWRDTP